MRKEELENKGAIMNLSQLGERKIIRIFEREFGKSKCRNAIVGIGDDACVVKFGSKLIAISTDAIYQKTHIPREMTPRQIGKFAVNVNLSDIAAMGAAPLGLVFSFALPSSLDENFVGELSKGINEACREHKTCVLGGDTKEHSEIVIAGTAFGSIENKILKRSAAKVGDLICITGSIGSAAAGFYCLTKNLKIGARKKLVKAALEPKARVREGILLGKHANACIDVSDGLAFSLHEIAKASKAGFLVYEEKIPVDKNVRKVAKLSGVPLREIVFHKGGEYELLFAISPKKFERMKEEIGSDVAVIGEIKKRGKKILNVSGEREELESRGYEAFITKF